MIDKAKFMEMLHSVKEIASVSDHQLTQSEIEAYFENMELSDEQLNMIQAYLFSNTSEEESTDHKNEDTSVNPQESKNSVFLQMYLDDISAIEKLTDVEVEVLYRRLVSGDQSVMQLISDQWLDVVVEIAKTYKEHMVNLEDLIQEGNIGLLQGMKQLIGSNTSMEVKEYLKESVQQSMENYIDEISIDDDWESTVLAKSNLIHEARIAMCEDLGRTPTISELSEYTRMSENEIADITRLTTIKEK